MGNVRLYGATSGYTELAPPAVAPDGVLSLPSGTGTIAKTTDQGLVHINTTTFSAVSSVSLNSVFTSTYDNYRVVVTSQGSITAQNYLIRYRTAGTDNSTSNYNTTRQDTNTGVVNSNFDSGQTSQNVGVTAIANDQLIVGEIFRPNLAALTLSSFTNWSTALTNILRFTGGYHNATTVFDGLTLFPATGTITGTIRVYGYKND